MKNFESILTELGIEVPEDKAEALKKAMHENYKTIAEFEKVESKANSYKEQAESAKEAISKFDGVDVEALNKEIADWKRKSEESEAEFKKNIAERDLNDAINREMDKLKFTSKSAKIAVTNKVRNSGVQLKEGKLYGLQDVLADIKAEDDMAFVNEEQQILEDNKAKFTNPINQQGAGGITKEEIMNLKDREARREAIKNNPHLFN